MTICDKCGSPFMEYNTETGYYTCRMRGCSQVDKTKDENYYKRESILRSYNTNKLELLGRLHNGQQSQRK